MYYSVLSAATGSFFAALLEGIRPEMSVRPILMNTRITATITGSCAVRLGIPVRYTRIALSGMQSR